MSRCIVKAKDPKQEIVVGLDPMLHEWFWQVFEVNAKDPDKWGEWIGGSDTFMPPSKSDLIEFMDLNCDMSDNYTMGDKIKFKDLPIGSFFCFVTDKHPEVCYDNEGNVTDKRPPEDWPTYDNHLMQKTGEVNWYDVDAMTERSKLITREAGRYVCFEDVTEVCLIKLHATIHCWPKGE